MQNPVPVSYVVFGNFITIIHPVQIFKKISNPNTLFTLCKILISFFQKLQYQVL